MSLQQNQQDIQDAEAALQALGISPQRFSQALQLLIKRRNAQQEIQKIQQNQFYNDAFNVVSQVQNTAASDKIVVTSQYLRTFAEYVASQTLTLQATYQDAKTIVDNIIPMGGGS